MNSRYNTWWAKYFYSLNNWLKWNKGKSSKFLGLYLDNFGPFLDRHGSVEPHVAVAPEAAELLEEVEGLSVVGLQNHFVAGGRLDVRQQAIEDGEFAGQLWL